MYEVADLEVLLKAGSPLIFCNTSDEQRALDLLKTLAKGIQKDAWSWSCVKGLERLEQEASPQTSLSDPQKLLAHLAKLSSPGIFMLLDFHHYLEDPKTIRLLKDLALSSNKLQHTIVFLSHEISAPAELSSFSVEYEFRALSRTEITKIIQAELNKYLEENKEKKVKANKQSLSLLINSLQGLPAVDVARLARTAIYDDAAVTDDDIAEVLNAKKALLQKDGVLEFEYDTANLSQVAGLSQLKTWLEQRRSVMLANNNTNKHLSPPKGVLLLGVQGCGKSLAAKAIAGSWKLPLLRLDMGAVFNKFMGETERRIRDALKNSESLAPCVLWVDELEKGISSTDFDGGTAQRVMGTLLTWMAERKSNVFFVATANNIDSLPAELLRKGRFDEVFFVDLPDETVRKHLFEIHLSSRDFNPASFDIDLLVKACEAFSGAEIEQLIVAGMYAAQDRNSKLKSPLSTKILLDEAKKTKPLSSLMSEQIDQLRNWAKDRCVFAD